MRVTRPFSSSPYLRVQNSSRAVTTGISAKLYSGAAHGGGGAGGPAAHHDVGQEQQDPEGDDERPDGGHEVPELEAEAVVVGVDPARHALDTEDVHRPERQVEADQHQPEVPLADLLG